MQPRLAASADADTLALIHVHAWQETYRDLLPAEEVEKYTFAKRQELWRNQLAKATSTIMIAGNVGFVQVGSQRDDALNRDGYTTEIYALYVLQHAQRNGIGYALLKAAISSRPSPFTALVLKTNARAVAFYKMTGGQLIEERHEIVGHKKNVDLVYGWPEPFPSLR